MGVTTSRSDYVILVKHAKSVSPYAGSSDFERIGMSFYDQQVSHAQLVLLIVSIEFVGRLDV